LNSGRGKNHKALSGYNEKIYIVRSPEVLPEGVFNTPGAKLG
jgi:hypothetical protein